MTVVPTRGTWRRRGAALAGSALILALAACAPGGAAPSPSASTAGALPEGVEVELYQLRSDVAERGAQVRLVNGSDDDLVITRVTFDDDWFTGASVRERESAIAAGRTVDLRIELPESACDDEPDAAERTSRVTLEFTVGDDDASRAATVEVADPLGFTELVHEKECLRHDLAQLATLEWTSFTPNAAPAQLVLSITPGSATAAATGELVQIETTNLLQFADLPTPFPLAIALPLAPDADTAVREVEVPLVPLRCDPHAVMEDKRGTVFNLGVQVDGAVGVVEVAASEQLRGDILRWVSDWCGFGPGQG
ncbi:MAG: hypothetical protein ABW091_13920 [Microbacterium sp.]